MANCMKSDTLCIGCKTPPNLALAYWVDISQPLPMEKLFQSDPGRAMLIPAWVSSCPSIKTHVHTLSQILLSLRLQNRELENATEKS